MVITKIHEFEESQKRGEKGEAVLDEFFSEWFDLTAVNREGQRSGQDRIFKERTNDTRWSFEYKTDERAATTGNAFIETVSVDTDNKPGWAYTSLAQMLVYFVPQWQRALIISMKEIKTSIPEWREKYGPEKIVPNDGYNTKGLAVPFWELERIALWDLQLDTGEKSKQFVPQERPFKEVSSHARKRQDTIRRN